MTDNKRRRIVICGAAGRDYHNFNCVYRERSDCEIVAFTATQIPGIDDRCYPAELAGKLYPQGIPVIAENQLEALLQQEAIDEVVFAYSDVPHEHVMHLASRALAAGTNFALLGPAQTQLAARCPVIAVSAVRTGCGKSQVARYIASSLRAAGCRIAAIRHPMPYGNLNRQRVQRFASVADIERANCTIEEREEYEPHVAAGNLVFAGVDYRAIVDAAEAEADLIVWDGGNNDFPFIKPDLHIVVTDALRPDHLTSHHPGEAVLRMADIVIVNKTNAALPSVVAQLQRNIEAIVPGVPIVLADSPVQLSAPLAAGAKVLLVEDGPTLTHGGMSYGAAWQAVQGLDISIVDPRASAVPEMLAVYNNYPHIRQVLPAVGYSEQQRSALRATIEGAAADVVVSATPIDLQHVLELTRPVVRVHYDYQDHGEPALLALIREHLPGLAGLQAAHN